MRKRYSFESMFDGNILVIFCVLFTVSMIFETIFSVIGGGTIHVSMIWRTIWLSATLLPLALFQYLWKSHYIDERSYYFWVGIPMHYLISGGLLLLYLFIWGFFEHLTPNAYLITLANYTVGYMIVMGGAAVIHFMQTSRANKNLRKIQASQRIGGR